MATVSSLGAGSGLDLQGLLDKLMVVEREPLTRLNTQKTSYQSKISALGTLTQKLEAVQTAGKNLKPAVLQSALDKFSSYTGVVADEKVASVTLGDGATSGSYKLEVSQLAQAQKSRIAQGDIALGSAGQFEIETSAGGGTPALSIDLAGIDSLTKLANAINQKGAGISATVINSGSGQQLVLTGQEGLDNAFTVSAGVSGTVTSVQAAQDAAFRLDGIDITSASNTVKDVATGVTLELKATNVNAPTNVSVEVNYSDKLKTGLESFIKAFNDTIDSIKSLGEYDAETQNTGALNGNRVLREAQTALRELVFQEGTIQNANGDKMTLSGLGITFNKEGKLELDSDKLATAIKDNPANVASFAAEMGERFNAGLNKLVGFDGSIKNIETGMRSSITRLDERVEKMEAQLLKAEERYRVQFSALDSLVTKMNSTSNYLAQQLATLVAK
ncbi:MAG: flagellar filament capping protein FliD [Azoarcus sp.]|jgi:flagellar hook-associated protein 2|nr:flagellar filament capping protein FliD [Azoarcus sp.]